MAFPATVWQQLQFGTFAWSPERAAKRRRFLAAINRLPVVAFSRAHAERAAELAAELKLQQIGFADFQIAASALEGRVVQNPSPSIASIQVLRGIRILALIP